MYKSGEKFSLTISGVNKKSAIPFLLEKFNNIENFTDEIFNNDDDTWFEYVSFEWT